MTARPLNLILTMTAAAALSATGWTTPRLLDATPAFARQTRMACSSCHYQFPELTAIGREFKLNGYTMQGIETISDKGTQGDPSLNLVAPLSVMLQTSYMATRTAVPGTQNGSLLFPDQLSLFLGGAITPKAGGFLQLTFDPQSGSFGV